MYYLFKTDFLGNRIPMFASQSGNLAFDYSKRSKDVIQIVHVPGNKSNLLGI